MNESQQIEGSDAMDQCCVGSLDSVGDFTSSFDAVFLYKMESETLHPRMGHRHKICDTPEADDGFARQYEWMMAQ